MKKKEYGTVRQGDWKLQLWSDQRRCQVGVWELTE